MKIAAKYADEWNVWGSPDLLAPEDGDPRSSLRVTEARPEVDQTLGAGAALPERRPGFLDKVKSRPGFFPMMAGGVDEIRAVVEQYAEAGVDELIIPDFNLGPRQRKAEVLDRFIEEVAPVAA